MVIHLLACKLFGGNCLDRDELAEARLIWSKTKDPVKALDALESFHCMERQLLEGLKRCSKNDLVSALAMVIILLYLLLLLMYIHSLLPLLCIGQHSFSITLVVHWTTFILYYPCCALDNIHSLLPLLCIGQN